MCSIAARTLLEARPKLSPRSAVTGQQVTVGRLEPQVELSGLENSFVATSTLPVRLLGAEQSQIGRWRSPPLPTCECPKELYWGHFKGRISYWLVELHFKLPSDLPHGRARITLKERRPIDYIPEPPRGHEKNE